MRSAPRPWMRRTGIAPGRPSTSKASWCRRSRSRGLTGGGRRSSWISARTASIVSATASGPGPVAVRGGHPASRVCTRQRRLGSATGHHNRKHGNPARPLAPLTHVRADQPRSPSDTDGRGRRARAAGAEHAGELVGTILHHAHPARCRIVPTSSPACSAPGGSRLFLDRQYRMGARVGQLARESVAPAVELGVPVLPVAVTGRELSRRWRVQIGTPVSPRTATGPGPLAVAETIDAVHAEIQESVDHRP